MNDAGTLGFAQLLGDALARGTDQFGHAAVRDQRQKLTARVLGAESLG